MQIKPSSDPLFRHRHQYVLRHGQHRPPKLWLWGLLFVVLLGVGGYYAYHWLNFTPIDLQTLMARFKSEQAQPVDADKARLENPQDIARQALKPASPAQASAHVADLNDAATTSADSSTRLEDAEDAPDTEINVLEAPAAPARDSTKTTIIVDETVLANLQKTPPAAPSEAAAGDASEAGSAFEKDTQARETESTPSPTINSEMPEKTQVLTDDSESSIKIAEGESNYTESAGGIIVNINIEPPTANTSDTAEAGAAQQQAEPIKQLQQQAKQQIDAQQLDAAFATYKELHTLEAKLASPVLDAIFIAYQEQLEAHLQADKLQPALKVYALMQQLDAQHISVNAALDAIMLHHQARMQRLLDRQRLLSGTPNALDLYEQVKQFAPAHAATQNLRALLLQALLNLAKSQIAAQKYTTPANDNAFDSYQAILKILPNHLGANEGLRNLATIYEKIANIHLANDRLDSANTAIQRGEKVLPQHPAWKKLREQIQQAQTDKLPSHAARGNEQVLIKRAEAQLEAGQLTRPSGDNAYETLQQLRAQYPDEPYAVSGMSKIADRYAELAEKKRQAGELQNSMALISEGLALAPSHAALQKLKQQVLAEY